MVTPQVRAPITAVTRVLRVKAESLPKPKAVKRITAVRTIFRRNNGRKSA